jgi:ABC-type dipeptide/oligopeptide/nickel transport system permease subunit
MTLSKGFKSIMDTVKAEIWSQTTGKVALMLLILLVALGIAAAIMLPPNFVQVWNDLKPWGLKPKNVPPQWASIFGHACAPHYEVDLRGVTYRTNITGNEVVIRYILTYDFIANGYPQGIAVSIDGFSLSAAQSFKVTVNIIRPDNVKVPEVISYLTIPIGMNIRVDGALLNPDSMKLASTLVTLYPQLLTIANVYDIAMKYTIYLFSKFSNATGILPLTGTYKVEVIVSAMYSSTPTAKDVDKLITAIRSSNSFGFAIIGTCYGALGTDYRGRDLFEALFFGLPIALLIGFGTAVATTIIGLFAGLVSGYYGGLIDEFIQRFVDVLGSIPQLPILILLAVAIQQTYGAHPNKPFIMLMAILGALIVFGWGGLAIVVRSMTLSIKSEAYVEAANVVGASNWWIMRKHIIPQLLPYIAAQMVYATPSAILIEAGLSILGLQHGLPTWGGVLADARIYGNIAYWWWIFPPGIAISVTSLTFVLLGLALERIAEPRLRRV